MDKSLVHVGIDATCWANDRGFGRMTRQLVNALASRASGFRYTLLFDQAPDGPLPPGVEVLQAGGGDTLKAQSTGAARRSGGYLFRLSALASRTPFDVFFFPAIYSYFPLFARTPSVVCFHDTIAERFPDLIFPTRRNYRLWQAKTALAKLQCRRAMTVSDASARDLEDVLKIPRAKIDVITEGPDPAFRILEDRELALAERRRLGVTDGAPLLVYVGGFNRHKNLLGLLKAMPEVLARRPDVCLAIVGDTTGGGFWDNVSELRALVDGDPRLQRNVKFTGYLADEALVALLNSASALVQPSLAEGFGLPAVEAMACGIPVLASRRGSLPELLGDAGLLFEPDDASDIVETLTRFLDSPELQARLAAAAREQVQLFTWDRAAELAEASFRRCYAGR